MTKSEEPSLSKSSIEQNKQGSNGGGSQQAIMGNENIQIIFNDRQTKPKEKVLVTLYSVKLEIL